MAKHHGESENGHTDDSVNGLDNKKDQTEDCPAKPDMQGQAHAGGEPAKKESGAADKENTPDDEKQEDRQPEQGESSENSRNGEGKMPRTAKAVFYFTLNTVYDYLYFIGIQFLRSMFKRWRHLLHAFYRLRGEIARRSERWRRSLKTWRIERWWAFTTPLRELNKRYQEFRRDLFNARHYHAKGKIAKAYLRIAGLAFKAVWHALRFALNYIAPVVGILIFVSVVNMFNSVTYALHVEYNGEDMGYIKDEGVFNTAELAMRERINAEDYISPEDSVPKFEIRIINQEQLVSVDELTNKLIRSSGNELKEAYGLYISDKFVSAVDNGDELLLYLNSMLEKYETPDLGEDAQAQFVKKIQLKPGLYPVTSVEPLDAVKAKLTGEEKGEKIYTVVSGDDGLKIAMKNGITFEELKRLNPMVDVSLFPGDELTISQSVPFLGVRVKTLLREEEDIPFKVTQEVNTSLDRGVASTKVPGEIGKREITREVILMDGVEVESSILNSRIVKEPIEQIIIVGSKNPTIPSQSTPDGQVSGAPLNPGAFMWPTTGGRIYPGFLGYSGHTGSDISWSGCYGAPIYASMEGVVTGSGWRGAYGYCVVIDHGNGYQTLYAHCSSLNVSVGDYVEQGQTIAHIGSTGNSTGPHVHFEIRINGKPVDAAPYLYGEK